MKRNRPPSKSTLRVLETLLSEPHADRYGYELMKTTQLKSGTLYPILMRLTDRGFLESSWRSSPLTGRPPRHAYRLTQAGLAFAQSAILQDGKTVSQPKRKRRA